MTLMLIALAVVALAVAAGVGYAYGRRVSAARDVHRNTDADSAAHEPSMQTHPERVRPPPPAAAPGPLTEERARLVRSYEAEATRLRGELRGAAAERAHLLQLADERRQLFCELATTRGETARYRQLVIDIENDAPPPLLGGRGTPDDLKLIVGIGPVLERMLHQLGITTYRQIARWTERDIDDFDARLAEFPGRIRRDAWVTQARALHQGLHGESL